MDAIIAVKTRHESIGLPTRTASRDWDTKITGQRFRLRAALDSCNEMDFAARADGLQQAHGCDLAIHRYGDVGPQPILLQQAVTNAGPGSLQAFDHLSNR